MNKTRKILCFVLVIVMALSLVPFAAASAPQPLDERFTDTNTIPDQHREALDVLTALEVIVGVPNPDGTTSRLSLERDITRAEAAAIVTRILVGPDAAANLRHPTSRFTDVLNSPTSAWANAYIEYLAELGIVAGVGGGRFAPESNVTGVQMARMLLSAIGYGQNDEFVGGGWDLRVLQLALAHDIEILSRVGNIDFNAPATRVQVAQYTFNALVIPHTVSWNAMLGIYSVSTGVGQLERWNPSLGFRTFGLFPVRQVDTFGYPTHVWRLTTARNTNITAAYGHYTVIASATDHRGIHQLLGPGNTLASVQGSNLEIRYNGRVVGVPSTTTVIDPATNLPVTSTVIPANRSNAVYRAAQRGVIVELVDSYMILQQVGVGGALGGGAGAADLGIIRRGDGVADSAIVIDKTVGRLTGAPITLPDGNITFPGLFNYAGPSPLQGTQTFPGNTVFPDGLSAGDVVLYVQGNANQWHIELAESVTGNFTSWTPTSAAPQLPGTATIGGNSYLGTGLRRGLQAQGGGVTAAPTDPTGAVNWPTVDLAANGTMHPIILIDEMWQFVPYASGQVHAGGQVTVWLDDNGSIILFSVGDLPTPDYLLLLSVQPLGGTGMTATVLPADGSTRVPRDVTLTNWAAVGNLLAGNLVGAPISRDQAFANIEAALGLSNPGGWAGTGTVAAGTWVAPTSTPRLMAFTGDAAAGGAVSLTVPRDEWPDAQEVNRSSSLRPAPINTFRTRDLARFIGTGAAGSAASVWNLTAPSFGPAASRYVTRDPGNTVYIVQMMDGTFRQSRAVPIYDANEIQYADIVAFTQRPAGQTLAQAAFFRGLVNPEVVADRVMMFVGLQFGTVTDPGRVIQLAAPAFDAVGGLFRIAWVDTSAEMINTPATDENRHYITGNALAYLRDDIANLFQTGQNTEMLAEVVIEYTGPNGAPIITEVNHVSNPILGTDAIIVPAGAITLGAALADLSGAFTANTTVYGITGPNAAAALRHTVDPGVPQPGNAGLAAAFPVTPGWLVFVERDDAGNFLNVFVRREVSGAAGLTLAPLAASIADDFIGDTATVTATAATAITNIAFTSGTTTGLTLNANLAAGTFTITADGTQVAGTVVVTVTAGPLTETFTLTITSAALAAALADAQAAVAALAAEAGVAAEANAVAILTALEAALATPAATAATVGTLITELGAPALPGLQLALDALGVTTPALLAADVVAITAAAAELATLITDLTALAALL